VLVNRLSASQCLKPGWPSGSITKISGEKINAGVADVSAAMHQLPLSRRTSSLAVRADGAWVVCSSSALHARRKLIFSVLGLLLITTCAIALIVTVSTRQTQKYDASAGEMLDAYARDTPRPVGGEVLHIGDIHRGGISHAGVWIFAFDGSLNLLLARRSPTLRTCPGMWLILGEHLSAGENAPQAAARCLREEAAFIQGAELKPAGRYFRFYHRYEDAAGRVDLQWTKSFVALPRSASTRFTGISESSLKGWCHRRALKLWRCVAGFSPDENGGYRGIGLPDLVKSLVGDKEAFCNPEQRIWTLRAVSAVACVLREQLPELYKKHLELPWEDLIKHGYPVCCAATADVAAAEMDLSLCGQPCPKPAAVA
jgi:hypothetical protein